MRTIFSKSILLYFIFLSPLKFPVRFFTRGSKFCTTVSSVADGPFLETYSSNSFSRPYVIVKILSRKPIMLLSEAIDIVVLCFSKLRISESQIHALSLYMPSI